jgi:hypothetical protein
MANVLKTNFKIHSTYKYRSKLRCTRHDEPGRGEKTYLFSSSHHLKLQILPPSSTLRQRLIASAQLLSEILQSGVNFKVSKVIPHAAGTTVPVPDGRVNVDLVNFGDQLVSRRPPWTPQSY